MKNNVKSSDKLQIYDDQYFNNKFKKYNLLFYANKNLKNVKVVYYNKPNWFLHHLAVRKYNFKRIQHMHGYISKNAKIGFVFKCLLGQLLAIITMNYRFKCIPGILNML